MQNVVLHAVCATDDVAAGAMVAVEIGDLQIAIYHAGGEFLRPTMSARMNMRC